MPYLFTCPHCQTRTQVEDRYSGQKGECVTCGAPIEIPEFAGTNAIRAGVSSSTAQKKPVTTFVTAGVVALILVCGLFAIIKYGGETVATFSKNRIKTQSMENLETIANAMNAYAADYGRYPPAYTTGGPNNRMFHSWRVLLLPYLNEPELYEQFDLTKPWDHQLNREAAYRMPEVYEHPEDASGGYSLVSGYYLITGPGTLFPKGKSLKPADITDDGSQTILVIEARMNNRAQSWAQPIDLDYAKMKGQIGGTLGIEAGGWVDDGAAMATSDGRSHFLEASLPASTFNSLVTPQGNEKLPDDTLN